MDYTETLKQEVLRGVHTLESLENDIKEGNFREAIKHAYSAGYAMASYNLLIDCISDTHDKVEIKLNLSKLKKEWEEIKNLSLNFHIMKGSKHT